MKNWMIYERTHAGDDATGANAGVDVPPEEDELGQRERQSTPLSVSPYYREHFEEFAGHFGSETAALNDPAVETGARYPP